MYIHVISSNKILKFSTSAVMAIQIFQILFVSNKCAKAVVLLIQIIHISAP